MAAPVGIRGKEVAFKYRAAVRAVHQKYRRHVGIGAENPGRLH
jgi:hypothetical protein